MQEQFIRTSMLLGEENIKKLQASKVAIFGIGGVGGYVAEALARSGIGEFDLFDKDVVDETNINRQIIATLNTIGKNKVDVMKERILEINKYAKVNAYKEFYLPETADKYDLSKYDYIIDAIDTVTSKIELIVRATNANVKVISAMGAGNKLDPTKFEVTDIYKTSVCPLAKIMRKELKQRGIKKLKVVYSKEESIKIANNEIINGKNYVRKYCFCSIGYGVNNRRRSSKGYMLIVSKLISIIIGLNNIFFNTLKTQICMASRGGPLQSTKKSIIQANYIKLCTQLIF